VSRVILEFSDSASIRFENRKLEEGDHNLADNMDWDQEIVSGNSETEGSTVFLINNGILKPEPRKLEESRGLVTADYQNHLEKQWIQTLREKYNVNVNMELLSGIKE